MSNRKSELRTAKCFLETAYPASFTPEYVAEYLHLSQKGATLARKFREAVRHGELCVSYYRNSRQEDIAQYSFNPQYIKSKPGRPKTYNEIEVVGGTTKIFLNRGYVALIDTEDWEKVKDKKWAVSPQSNTTYCRNSTRGGGTISLHRLIMNAPKDMDVDHIDHNGLNNTKSNLRICTTSENCRNRVRGKISSSKYKGVYFYCPTKKWRSAITIAKGKRIYLGQFLSEESAAIVYNEMAKKYFGEYAIINDVTDQHQVDKAIGHADFLRDQARDEGMMEGME